MDPTITVLLIMGAFFGGVSLLNHFVGKGVMSDISRSYENDSSSRFENGSIGSLIEKDVVSAEEEGLEALLDTSVDRKDAMNILEWFDGKIQRADYHAIRETEAKDGEPNYAFVMTNDSGYNFKEFSCKARVFTKNGELPAVNCVAKDWKDNTEGQMWFYYPAMDITKMIMEAMDIKYSLDIDAEVDSLRRRIQRLADEAGVDIPANSTPVRKPAPRSNYIKSGWTRHDAFSQILHDNPPRTEYRDGDIVVLNVKFSPSGHTYCYRTNDDVYKPGDVVEVRVSGVPKAVTVDSVGYYSKEEYPFDVVQLNYVEGMAAGELADRYKEAVEAEKNDEAEREKIRTAAMKELKTARKERAEATRMHDEATEARKEAEEKKKAAEQAIKETKDAGEKARLAEAKLEAAKKEAAKTWKRKRPKTDNEIIKSLRKVQDALDEDEQIYKDLSALETKMSKVIEKSEEMIDDETNTDTTNTTIRRLYSYYLPKTISVLEQYKNIFSSGLPPKNVEELRQDLLDAIDKSEEVYDNVLTDLYEKDIMELEIEMEVLKTMFALSGLMDSDFDVKV